MEFVTKVKVKPEAWAKMQEKTNWKHEQKEEGYYIERVHPNGGSVKLEYPPLYVWNWDDLIPIEWEKPETPRKKLEITLKLDTSGVLQIGDTFPVMATAEGLRGEKPICYVTKEWWDEHYHKVLSVFFAGIEVARSIQPDVEIKKV